MATLLSYAKAIRLKHLQGQHDQQSHGGGSSADYTVRTQNLARGLTSRVYGRKDSPDTELQVTKRKDGRRSIATFYVPPGERGRGTGRGLLLRALQDGDIIAKLSGEASGAAESLRKSLLRDGLIEIYQDEYGVDLMRLAE